jgi:hypothetical protein
MRGLAFDENQPSTCGERATPVRYTQYTDTPLPVICTLHIHAYVCTSYREAFVVGVDACTVDVTEESWAENDGAVRC